MREESAEGNRAAYPPRLARSVWRAARVRQVLGVELDAALVYCDQAIGHYRELSEAEPDVFSDDLATVEAPRQALIEQRVEPAWEPRAPAAGEAPMWRLQTERTSRLTLRRLI